MVHFNTFYETYEQLSFKVIMVELWSEYNKQVSNTRFNLERCKRINHTLYVISSVGRS